jgi:hypothetical protein
MKKGVAVDQLHVALLLYSPPGVGLVWAAGSGCFEFGRCLARALGWFQLCFVLLLRRGGAGSQPDPGQMPANPPAKQPANPTANQPANPARQLDNTVGQPTNLPATLPASQPANQPGNNPSLLSEAPE